MIIIFFFACEINKKTNELMILTKLIRNLFYYKIRKKSYLELIVHHKNFEYQSKINQTKKQHRRTKIEDFLVEAKNLK